MNADTPPLVPEELLAHANFVRALAARLLDLREDAEDVEQDAWLASLRVPPRERARARGWLGRVVQRFAIELRRTAESRERRERIAASSEALVSTQDLAAKNEVLRLVADAVVALDEKHRAVILLRFYDGSPTSDLARRLGLPLETARSRLKRALLLLREDLDQRAKGGRDQWLAALGAAFPPPSGSIVVAVASSATVKLLTASAIVALFIGGAWIWKGRGRPTTKDEPTASAGHVDAAKGAVAPALAAAPAPSRSPDATPAGPPPAATQPPPSEPAPPVAAVGTVVVTVVDAHGRLVPGRASLTVRPAGSTKPGSDVHARLDKDHPQLKLENAPEGDDEVVVSLEDRPSGKLRENVVVRATQTTSLTLRYGGPDPATSICVRLDRAIVDAPPIAEFTAADASSITPEFSAEMPPFLVASPVGSGPYTLRIDDPRWKPVRVDGLHAFDAIKVELVGSATLRVVVRKSAGGPAIAGAGFTIAASEGGSVIETPAPPPTANADGSLTLAGLEPDSFTLVVHVEGAAVRRVPIEGLRSGETREIEVVLDADAGERTIKGVLYADDALTPLAKRTVALYSPAQVDDSPNSMWFYPLPASIDEGGGMKSSFVVGGPGDRMRIGKARVETDDEGRFRFTGIPPGRWILRYTSKSGIDSVLDDVVLDTDHPSRSDLELVESNGATIVGRLVTRNPAGFSGTFVSVELNQVLEMARMEVGLGFIMEPVAIDGSFRIGPLPPGPLQLRIRDDGPVTVHGENSEQTAYCGSGDGLELAKVDLPSRGEKIVEIPADSFIPGRIDLTLVVDGKPESGLLACAVRAPGNSIDFPRGGKSDENGHVELARLLPGELRITIASPASGWTLSDVVKVNLPPAGTVDQVIKVETFDGSLSVFDRSGTPLRERALFVGTPVDQYNDVAQWATVRTDADGMLRLRWPAGHVILSLIRDPEADHKGPALLDWTPDGPKPAEVRVH